MNVLINGFDILNCRRKREEMLPRKVEETLLPRQLEIIAHKYWIASKDRAHIQILADLIKNFK